jgi:N-acetylglucosamine-6-phosphate deacetylase
MGSSATLDRKSTCGAAAVLDDGTLAGSTATMDAVFRTIVRGFGRSVPSCRDVRHDRRGSSG